MTKIETTTDEIGHCGECSNADYSLTVKNPLRHKCHKTKRVIPDIWGEIPSWCPLETKEEK